MGLLDTIKENNIALSQDKAKVIINELLMKNNQSRLTGSIAYLEAIATNYSDYNNYNSRGRGRGRGCGTKNNNAPQYNQTTPQKKMKSVNNNAQEKPQKSDNGFYRYDSKGH